VANLEAVHDGTKLPH